MLADVTVNAPTGFWVAIINFFRSFITDYGWCVIVFTVSLRLVLLPLDFFQKKVSYDNKKKTEAMEPYMEKLRKQYGNDRMAMSQKQRELQKKFKVNMLGPCLPALISMVIFITLFGGFRKIADFEIYTAYNETKNAYVSSYTLDTEDKFNELDKYYEDALEKNEITQNRTLDFTEFSAYLAANKDSNMFSIDNVNLVETLKEENDPTNTLYENNNNIYDALLKSMAQDSAVTQYGKQAEGMDFLWIKNMWRPDVVWGMNGCGFSVINPVVPTVTLYKNSLTSDYMKEYKADTSVDAQYGLVMQKVISTYNNNDRGKPVYNGYYILAVIIIGLSFLSTKFNAAGSVAAAPQEAMGGAGGQSAMPSMKMMKFLMPAMMAIFAISSNSAFALYMVASSATALLSTFLCTFAIKKYDKYKTAKAEGNKFSRYGK